MSRATAHGLTGWRGEECRRRETSGSLVADRRGAVLVLVVLC